MRRIRKRRINKNNKYKLALVFVLFVGMFIAYEALTKTLNITGNTIVQKKTLGSWVETPSSESLSKVYSLGSTSRSMHASAEVSLNNNRATRPAIEVAKIYIILNKYKINYWFISSFIFF